MSGGEVVGLILAVIPLVISGLDHYGEGVRTINKMRKASKEFFNLRRELEIEYTTFRNTLEFLLKDDVEEECFAALFDDVKVEMEWANPSIDKHIRRRLGYSYTPFTQAVEHMAETIKEFQGILQLDENGQGPFSVDKWSVSEALRKIKFGLRMKAYNELMNVLIDNNRRLWQLTVQNDALTPIRASRRKYPDLEEARSRAQAVFLTLQKGLLQSCAIDHRASLSVPVPEATGSKIDSENSTTFRVVLHHDPAPSKDQLPLWIVEEAEIRLLESERAIHNSKRDHEAIRSVRFKSLKTPTATQSMTNIKEVKDLCKDIHILRGSEVSCDICVGYLSDVSSMRRHGLYRPKRPIIFKATTTTTSLTNFLETHWRLSEPDKRRLSLALALGILRLYDTSWLRKQWGRDEVVLFQEKDIIAAGQPFISANIGLAQPYRSKTYFTPCPLIIDETVFALGIVLIEICLGKPFNQLSTPEDRAPDGTKHVLSDYLTASRLIQEVYVVAGDRYGDVVRRCIRCEFDLKENSLGNNEFRKAFYKSVVEVLELELADSISL